MSQKILGDIKFKLRRRRNSNFLFSIFFQVKPHITTPLRQAAQDH
jgi:hypothetical protein